MDIKKLAPWNWFKKEEEEGSAVPVIREHSPRSLKHERPMDPGLQLQQNIERLFDDVFRSSGLPSVFGRRHDSLIGHSLLKPQVDIAANESAYTVTVEIPGVDEKDVHLELIDDTLVIRGEKKQEREEKKQNYYCVERSYGSFQRTLNLPKDADQDDIKASFKRGVLTIKMPRWTTPDIENKKQIEIQ